MRTPEENRAHVKKWREANPERCKQLKRESTVRHPRTEYERAYYLENRERKLAISRAWYRDNKERRKQLDLQRLYGIGVDWYEVQVKKQNGLCAICGKPPITNRLAIDHNHATNKNRGLLCGPCNSALNRVESVPNWGAKADAYLAEYDV